MHTAIPSPANQCPTDKLRYSKASIDFIQIYFHLLIDVFFLWRYSVPIGTLLNHAVQIDRLASPSSRLRYARKIRPHRSFGQMFSHPNCLPDNPMECIFFRQCVLPAALA